MNGGITVQLTRTLKISLWTAVGTLGTSIGGAATATWWFAGKLADLQRGQVALDEKLDRMVGERYTVSAAAEQALRMALENPGLRVPDPRDPSRIIESRGTK